MKIFLNGSLAEKNAALAIAEAIRQAAEGDVIHLGGGQLTLDNSFASPTSYYLPRYTDKTKYYSISLKGKQGLVIDGDGATLLLRGDVSGIELEDCRDITLRNFKIDIPDPYYWQGMITESSAEYFEVEFDQKISPCEYDADKKVFRLRLPDGENIEAASMLVNEFDPKTKRVVPCSPDYFLCADKPDPFYGHMSVVVKTQAVGENKLRFYYREDNTKKIQHRVGTVFVGTSHERRNNNIHINRCANVTLENIDMYASASFGVISLLTENFTARNVNSVLKPISGRMLAVIADMLHCVNNSGSVTIDSCTLNNQKDDAINVHSLLCAVDTVLEDGCTAIISFPYRAKRALDLFRRGERLRALTPDTLTEVRNLTVAKSELFGQYHLRVCFEEDISGDEGLFLESVDAMPKINITGCSLGNNRGRGILVSSSRQTVISDNRIYCHGSGISVNGASTFYMEGGAVNGVVIKNNFFDDCSYKGRPAIRISPGSIADARAEPYHRDITVTDNRFRLRSDNAIEACLVSGLHIDNNSFVHTDGTAASPLARVRKCEGLETHGIRMVKE